MKKISFINKMRNINTLDELFYKITQKINLLLTFPKGGFTRYPVDVFMKKISSTKVSNNIKVLDVGAGNKPYKNLFNNCLYAV